MFQYFMEGFKKSEQFRRYKKELCDELEAQRREEFNIRSASAGECYRAHDLLLLRGLHARFGNILVILRNPR